MHVDDTSKDESIKCCTKCGEAKPATAEYFSRHEAGRNGLRAACKTCESKRRRAYREANKDRIAEYKRAWRAANPERQAEYSRAYREANKDRERERKRAYRKANPERDAEYSRAWRAANPEHQTEYWRAYRKANKQRRAEYLRAWLAANPEAEKAKKQRRRARKQAAEGTHTAADIQDQYKRQKGRCYWCSEKVGDNYHVDHIVPLSRGGSNWPDNIVIACPTCNISKRDKLPHEWAKGGRLI